MDNKISWCFKIKNGLKLVEPNPELSQSYLEQSDKALEKVKQLLDEDDLVWASVRIYYSAYYSLYSFLQKIGVSSENHECSISLVKELLKEEFIGDIDRFKSNRIDSQYYLKVGKKEVLESLYKKAKLFYLKFKDIIEKTDDIDEYRKQVEKLR
jgi:uncharacterized protein (UPF0332 family)